VLKNAGIDEDHKFILYLGSETPRMNLELILKAMAKLKKLLPQVKLLKIGDPQSYQGRKNTIELMDKLNLSGDVILMGYVPEEDLPYWYSAVDVLVYPCLYAGFGLPPLEAMACGTPVITSNTSSIPEVMGDGGLMVDPYNPDELMVKLYEVLTMEDLNKKLIRKGLERAKSFKWDDSAKKTQRVYEELQKS
jgi:glycosyltransferase involved in cell wall biosynthesis